MVADFGIARAIGSDEQGLTQTGMTIGTPAYMSPEQASGDPNLDTRSDIYSLGCVLYELIAGEPPFTGPTPQAILARTLTETARPVSEIRATASSALTAVVARAIAREPRDRFATAADFAKALPSNTGETEATAFVQTRPRPRRFTALLSGVAVVGIALAALLWSRNHASATKVQRIAVLPFENEGSAEDEYFADGVTDEVRTKLASIPGIEVTARNSVAQYKKPQKSPREIGRELQVRYLLTGTVRWSKTSGSASRVRVNPELIDVESSASKWSQTFEAGLSDVFQVQSDIAGRVAQALDVALGAGTEQRLAARPTRNLDAYDAFLKGEEITDRLGKIDESVLRQALVYYQRAVSLDSTFAKAWSSMAVSYTELVRSNPSVEGNELARGAAERALALDPASPEARMAMGRYLHIVAKDYARALEQYTLGLKANPNNADLLARAATVEQALGRWDEAVAHLSLAARLDPRSVITARAYAHILHDVRRYPEATAEVNRGLALSPTNAGLVQAKSTNFISMGLLDSARATIRDAMKRIDTAVLLTRFAKYQEQMWVFEPEFWPRFTQLTLADFDGDRGHWGLKLGGTWKLLGDTVKARAFGDTALKAFEGQLRGFPDDAQLHELRGRALALGGRNAEAIEEANTSLRMRETELDASTGPYVRYQVARILIQAGDLERALDLLTPLLTEYASDLTPAWLRLDPSFKPLRGNPRFEKLIAAP
jgi:serine/threonine-protein kinase